MVANHSKKVAIVTGGAGDIGFAVVKRLVRLDYRVAVWDVKSQSDIDSLLQTLNNKDILGISVDARNYNEVEKAYRITTEKLGSDITVLINAIGRMSLKQFHELTPEEWTNELVTNLVAPAYVIRAIIPDMLYRNKEGTIINITSIWSMRAGPLRSAYIAAKWGLLALTKSLQEEYRSKRIRFVAISPGPVYTGMTKPLLKGPKPPEWMDPEDIAEVVEFVLTKGKYIVGGEIQVYGWGAPVGL